MEIILDIKADNDYLILSIRAPELRAPWSATASFPGPAEFWRRVSGPPETKTDPYCAGDCHYCNISPASSLLISRHFFHCTQGNIIVTGLNVKCGLKSETFVRTSSHS